MAEFNEFFTVMEGDVHEQILLDFDDIEVSVIKCDWTSNPWFEVSWHNKGQSNWANPTMLESMQDLFNFMNWLTSKEVIKKGMID